MEKYMIISKQTEHPLQFLTGQTAYFDSLFNATDYLNYHVLEKKDFMIYRIIPILECTDKLNYKPLKTEVE